MSETVELDEHLERTVLVEDPCPHGIPSHLCSALCAGDPSAVATVRLDRSVGHSLALDCQLAGAAPDLLTDAQLFDVVEGAERQQRWATALRTRMIAEIAARHPRGSRAAPPDADPRAIAEVSRWLPDHLGMVLGVTREQALSMLAEARRFRQVLPATLAALWLGGTAEQTEVSWRCVDRLARSLGTSDPRTLDQKRVDLAHELLQGTLSVTELGTVQAAVDSVLAAVSGTTQTPMRMARRQGRARWRPRPAPVRRPHRSRPRRRRPRRRRPPRESPRRWSRRRWPGRWRTSRTRTR